jgi:phosphomannomutase/phosphoglucomutase
VWNGTWPDRMRVRHIGHAGMPALVHIMVSLSKTIFKAYDIRGIIDKTLDAGIAYKIGHAFGLVLLANGEQRALIGRDGRLSGPTLSAALALGLQSSGIAVTDLGIVATPLLYFGTKVLGIPSGIMVTGSHNPPDYNGFKIVQAGEAIYGAAIQQLYRAIAATDGGAGPVPDSTPVSRSCPNSDPNSDLNSALQSNSAAPGSYVTHDIRAAYLARIVGDIKLARPIKLVIDCGNGVAGAFAGDLLRAMGCDVIELFCEVDGTFPNHHPDPARPENLQDLLRCLRETDAEIGLAFDGDGDRLGVVTKDGQIIYPDRQMMLFAADVLTRHSGQHIVYDVKCTAHLAPWIRVHGGVPLMWKTGHSLLKAKLRETGAPLAGEMSGHIIFQDRWYGFDDAMYAGARLLEIVTRAADASALLNALPQSACTPELELVLDQDDNVALIDALIAVLHDPRRSDATFPGHQQIIAIDGLRVEYADGFGLVRSSNTTPAVVLRFEGQTPAALARIMGQFKSAILSCRPGAVLPF